MKLGPGDLMKRFVHEKEAYPKIEAVLSAQNASSGALAVTALSASDSTILGSNARLFLHLAASVKGEVKARARTRWSSSGRDDDTVVWSDTQDPCMVVPVPSKYMTIELSLQQASISHIDKLKKSFARTPPLAIATFVESEGEPFLQRLPLVSKTGSSGHVKCIISYVCNNRNSRQQLRTKLSRDASRSQSRLSLMDGEKGDASDDWLDMRVPNTPVSALAAEGRELFRQGSLGVAATPKPFLSTIASDAQSAFIAGSESGGMSQQWLDTPLTPGQSEGLGTPRESDGLQTPREGQSMKGFTLEEEETDAKPLSAVADERDQVEMGASRSRMMNPRSLFKAAGIFKPKMNYKMGLGMRGGGNKKHLQDVATMGDLRDSKEYQTL